MEQKNLRQRVDIPETFKWHLEDIFRDEQAWEQEFVRIENLIGEGQSFVGHLGDDAETLTACLEWMENLSEGLGEVYAYARMRRDEDNREARYQALTDRAGALAIKVSSGTSFVIPELMSLSAGRIEELRAEPGLSLYRQALDDIFRKRLHILSPGEEKLLAEVGELADAPGTIFTMANNADLKFPVIRDDNGQEVELTKGNYIQFMESNDRTVRQEAFATLYQTYKKQVNTWAATLNASVKSDVFLAQARKYATAIEASLDDDNVDVSVYDNLIKTVHEFLPEMHRYVRLRQKAMGLDEIHMYDIYVPIVPEAKIKVSYEQSKQMIMDGLKPLGEEYLTVLQAGFDSGWIDVYENEGKTSGAYSWGTYRTHPYVLLNYQETLDAMFTVAHEMGHSLHTYFSNRTQPHLYSGYKIFVAEVASTLNEILIMEHLLKTTTERQLLAYIVNHYLEQFRGTVFRQTMFAEFERIIHSEVEQGGALTAESLSQIYRDLNFKYYGPDMVLDEEIALEWTRIPHFYNGYYVYKYATGFSAAAALARKILEEGQPAVERYLTFLASGSSDYPIELLRQAGVDMDKPEPIRDALQVFSRLLDLLESLLEAK